MSKSKVLITGNEAIAQGAIDAGCRFYAGYPITPQNELPAYMARQMPAAGGIFIQAESELAAINMVFGAAAAGVRAMTSSSSPGISLKQEGISYIAGAELPAVIVNIMRGGPGLGNIWPAQSDYFQATRGGGHGDYRSIVLAPSSIQEAYELMFLAFDLADKYRIPAIILGDGILGQMMEPLLVDSRLSLVVSERPATSDQQPTTKNWALTGAKGRPPNIVKSFYMKEGDLEKFNLCLQEKYKVIQGKEERFESLFLDDAKLILVAYGTMARIAKSVVQRLRKEGKKAGLIRPITLWPFPQKIFQRLAISDKRLAFLVIEMSYGQMLEDVKLAVCGKAKVEFFGRSGGGVPTEEEIIKKFESLKV
ncbi:MAG: 3-methyl-2-oxobutanoate dehydrogenase subunit VorB [Candidatus Omnitrophica bacterium]|nr:3-methyl-2-oxobutanoate dehydrogenase subunit VorB [Candidatus Omnitrophota bacterium]MDD5592452.1 3-methyl-2-oxobutanoate dehydrogenase subunit VorB [Candidatus Omnitrophota bacterium]